MTLKRGVESIVKLLTSKGMGKAVVMGGAGISTPSGIPDFRTPNSGLYDNLEKYNLPYPEAIFDIGYFQRNPKPFFQLAKAIYPGQFPPNSAHWFVRLLEEKGKLLRMYTQNIDGLETLAGISRELLVEAHGSFMEATCRGCGTVHTAKEIRKPIFDDQIPHCKKCDRIVKPDIVFFGEMLPDRFMLHDVDIPMADLLIVMGTSLEVYPFASLPQSASQNTPRVLINKESVGTFAHDPRPKDVLLLGKNID